MGPQIRTNMSHSAIATYIRPGHPIEHQSLVSIGNTWVYRGPTAVLYANKPSAGELWADGRPVESVVYFEITAASGLSEMTVVTSVNFTPYFLATGGLEEVVYEIEWRPVMKSLEVHPAFQSGEGKLDATARKHILGWKAEQDPELKSERKYKKIDSDGVASGSITTISGRALDFIKMIENGVEEYVDFMPIWRKRSIYRGSSAPEAGDAGMKGEPDGSGYPSGYEWVKSRDSAVRIGRRARWQRDEEWEGAKKVYVDSIAIYP